MKEVLIYGALVAAVMGAAVPLITNFRNTALTQGDAINQAMTTSAQTLIATANQ